MFNALFVWVWCVYMFVGCGLLCPINPSLKNTLQLLCSYNKLIYRPENVILTCSSCLKIAWLNNRVFKTHYVKVPPFMTEIAKRTWDEKIICHARQLWSFKCLRAYNLYWIFFNIWIFLNVVECVINYNAF